MMRPHCHWGDDGRSGEHRVPLWRGGWSGFGRSVDNDLGCSSSHSSASSRDLLLSSSSLSSEEEMGLNVPPSLHGTTTTPKTATAATAATTIAAATERNVDRRGCLDRTTPSMTRYGDASVPPFSSTIDDARQDGVLGRDGWSSDGRTTAASSS
jgi:hypothetical protein